MATEFKLNYTGSEINAKLETVDEIRDNLINNYYTSADIDTKFSESDIQTDAKLDEVNTRFDEVGIEIENLDIKFNSKADLVDGKVPLEQLPDNIGSGDGLVEVDWETNIINRPFYDTRIRSYYSQVETPNPPQVDNAMLNMSFYKVSDLVPTRDEIFGSTKVIINDSEYTFSDSGIQLETDDFIFVMADVYAFIFVNKSGTLNFTYSGYPMSLEIPENGEGIYYSRGLNEGVPEGRTIEFQIGDGELKQIDPKFIPANLDFNLDDYYTKSEIDTALDNVSVVLSDYYTKSEVYTKTEVDEIIGDIDMVINEINTLIGE